MFIAIALLIILIIKIITASIMLPFLIIYIVVQCFMGSPETKPLHFGSYTGDYTHCTVLLGQAKINVLNDTLGQNSSPLEYRTIIASSTIDLTDLKVQTLNALGQALVIQCNNTLGSMVLKIAKDIPIYISAKGFLGTVELPGQTTIVIGSHIYRSHPQEQPLLIIYSTTILGKTIIERT